MRVSKQIRISRPVRLCGDRSVSSFDKPILRLALFLLCTSLNQAGAQSSFTLSSIGTTSTQAILAYTAPIDGACAIQVSESASYSPLVPDLDTALFTGADLDSRAGSVSNGAARTFVVGARLPAVAADGMTYSRSLQANTQHYYQVQCGGSVSAGTFTTANIPVGSTYNEPPPANPSVPGGWLLPTRDGTRTQKVVDPQTGALLSPVSLPGDQVGGTSGSVGVTIGDGAQFRPSNPGLHTDGSGNVGYLLNLSAQVGWNHLYFQVPATGESRLLGWIAPLNASFVDDNLQMYAFSDPNFTQYNYTGAYAAHVGGVPGFVNFDAGTPYLTSSIATLMHDFDPTFDASKYNCAPVVAAPGKYAITACRRSNQDSYGWFGVFSGTTRTIIAAWNSYITQPSKFCGIHEWNMVPGNNLAQVNWHALGSDFNLGTAAIATTLSAQSLSGTNAITVTGPPASLATGGDTVAAPAVTAGDRIYIVGVGYYVVASVASNTYTLTANLASTAASGTQVSMACNAPPSLEDSVWAITYWDFLNDIHAADTTGVTVVPDLYIPGGGHDDTGPLARVAETTYGWGFRPYTGTVLSSLNGPFTGIDSTAAFNGVSPPGFGVLLTKHPSYQQATNDPWFLDRAGFNGGACCTVGGGYFYSHGPGQAVTAISGSLYQYFSDTSYPLARKLLATQASTGGFSVRDISGTTTGNVIGTGAGDNYKYCVAYKANECRTGSTAGYIYFNVPTLDVLYCTAHGGPYPATRDVCITNAPAYSGALMQLYMGSSSADSQSRSRNLTNGLSAVKNMYTYPMAKSLPDASYALFTIGVEGVAIDTWKVKLPPLPAPDGVNRTGYIAKSVIVPAGSQDNALVEFGYDELGGYCMTRAESCYAVAATIPVEPFKYPSDGTSETLVTLAGLPCASGCTIAVPSISQHVLKYRVVLRDVANAVLSTGTFQYYAVP